MVQLALSLWLAAFAVTSGAFVAVVAVQAVLRAGRRARAEAAPAPVLVERRRTARAA